MPTRTFSLPQSIIDRLDKYDEETKDKEWTRFNKSAVVADALDKKLKEEGY